MSESVSPVDNGVKVAALLQAREALTAAPEAAQFKWRASCKWVGGTHSQSKVESFFGLGEEQQRRTTFSFDADHPEIFASQDLGATPVEIVLVALAALVPLVTGMRYIVSQATLFFIWAIVVTQWNLVLGVGGIFSLAQMALFAVGAYSTAMLGYYFELPMLLAMPIAALVTVFVSTLVSPFTLTPLMALLGSR